MLMESDIHEPINLGSSELVSINLKDSLRTTYDWIESQVEALSCV
jgi:hypothetical protein